MKVSPLLSRLAREIRRFYGLGSDKTTPVRRFHALASKFRAQFPASKSFSIVRAPGRVNIIGEHTDYNGYPVLPIAIERDIVVAVAPSSNKTIEISNTESRFADRSFDLSEIIAPFDRGDWGNYVKAAVQGILDARLLSPDANGMKAVFSGTIPSAAGLSSSSALVVASVLAFLSANKREADKHILAELLPKAERYVGTESGGMDQAISLLGEQGKALRIDFFPLRTEPVPLPPGYTFVVSHSLVDASKSGAARSGYNLRVVECRLAAALLSHKLSQTSGRAILTNLLSDLAPEKIGMEEDDVLVMAREVMGELPLTITEIAQRLEQRVEGVIRDHCTLKGGSVLSPQSGGLKLWHRYRHVTSEARRVSAAVDALEKSDIAGLAKLMNESHTSCRDDYEVSCPELEELVETAGRHGALGARLTGAGFGGCTVNLVKESRVTAFIRGMRKDYYKRGRKNETGDEWINGKMERNDREVIFPCRASRGAGVIGEEFELS